MDNVNAAIDARVRDLKTWYADLTPESLTAIDQFYTDDAFFKDPFNEVKDRTSICMIFEHMFRTTENPRFEFIETITQHDQAFLSWCFRFALNGKQYEVMGASHLKFDESGRICMHRDYWDPAEELWQKIPVLGALIRWLRNKFVAH